MVSITFFANSLLTVLTVPVKEWWTLVNI